MNVTKSTYIVVDIEATCDSSSNGWKRKNMEVIEIGAVAVNDKLEIIGEFDCFIKPKNFPILSEYCKDLTHIKQEDVDSANNFFTVYKEFEKWSFSFECPIFCSWGHFDERILKKESNDFGLNFNFESTYNLKTLFSLENGISRGIGLRKALNYAKIEFIGTPHRAIDDAKNTSRLLKHIFKVNV